LLPFSSQEKGLGDEFLDSDAKNEPHSSFPSPERREEVLGLS
jgi:hypothetical protein